MAEKDRDVGIGKEQQADVKEFAALLKGLTDGEKREIKGIMIGMQIMRNQPTVKTA